MTKDDTDLRGREFVGIHFKCCNVYSRVYKSRTGDKYVGFCPRCGGKVQLIVGPDGIDDRFFVAR
jgi:hypothetical protein